MIPAAYAMLAGVLAIPASIVRFRTGRWPAAPVVTLLVWFGMCGWLRVGAKKCSRSPRLCWPSVSACRWDVLPPGPACGAELSTC